MTSIAMHRSEISDGIREASPILLAIVPFAAVFGALASDTGLTLGETMFASATIFAGASQYAMVDLMGQKVAPWVIVLTVFAINFRHVLYSASIGRVLSEFSSIQKALAFFLMVDPQYAAGVARAGRTTLQPAWYFSYAATIYTIWMVSNFLGYQFGALIENPEAFGFDFILPLYFTGLVVGFHKRPNFVPILLASVLASLAVYFTLGSPWHITLGGFGGLIVAAVLSKPTPAAGEGLG